MEIIQQKCYKHVPQFIQYILLITFEKVRTATKRMSFYTMTPVNDDTRYEIKMGYHKDRSTVVYQMRLFDLAFGKEQLLVFRFSQIKKFHEDLIKNIKIPIDRLPEFPKTNSFCFWNKTNTDPRKIQDRKRELQYYFTKLLNDPLIRGGKKVKTLLKNVVKQRRRTKSTCTGSTQDEKKSNKILSLPKQKLNNFPRSMKEEVLNLS